MNTLIIICVDGFSGLETCYDCWLHKESFGTRKELYESTY